MFKSKSAKIVPSSSLSDDQREEKTRRPSLKTMRVMSLETLFKLYGGQTHPRIETYEVLQKGSHLTEYRYMPHGASVIYISHEWVGSEHPDPRGDQMYHLLLLLERLQRGDVDRTDMDAFHSLVYKHTHSTTAEDWKRMLDPQKTFVFYDGFCMPRENREEAFRMIP